MESEKFAYDNKIVKYFAFATIVWGLIGMTVGLWVALQLVFPSLNLDTSFTTFGRIRPLHTNAVIFAFVGNGIFMGVYYSLQRLCKTRMFSDRLSWIHFWGWQLIIVSAVLTLPLGFTTGFNDIVLGFNGLFLATPGWDYTTGLGTIDISALNAALDASAPKSGVLPAAAKVASGRFGGALGLFSLLPLGLAALRRRRAA